MKQKNSLWLKIGSGEYNVVYKHLKKYKGITYVLKIPKDHDALSDPIRVARKWNLANPDLPATALNGPQIYWNIEAGVPDESGIPCNSIYLYGEADQLKAIIKNIHGDIERKDLHDLPDAHIIMSLIEEDASYESLSLALENKIRRAVKQPFRGMLAPYVEGTYELSEKEQAEALIQLYITTRQIVLDYDGQGNLIADAKAGKVRCVDFDETISCDSPRTTGLFFQKDVYQEYRRAYIDADEIKLGDQVNLSFLYLEKYLKHHIYPLEVLNKYMTAEIIFALYEFERKSLPLTIKTLDILFFLSHTYSGHKLHLSAEAIHALEINNDAFSSIEARCQEQNSSPTL